MKLAWADILFYIVFLGQIYLLSIYFARKLYVRMQHVIKTYPPEQFPKLYPQPVERYIIGQAGFRLANNLIAAIGVGIMLLMLFVIDHATFADDGYISEIWPIAYGFLQAVPLIVLEFSEWSQMKQMRKANTATTRKAELRPRSLFAFISPRLILVAVALLLAALVLESIDTEFEFASTSDGGARVITLLLTNLWIAAVGFWNLRGPRQNPHQALADRSRQISAVLHSILYVSMAVSVFFMSLTLSEIYALDYLGAIGASLYFQAVAAVSVGHIISSLRIDEIDFDVYRNGGPISA